MSAFLSKYGVARHCFLPLIKRGVVDFAVAADITFAAGDVKISKDGGAAANVTNLPTAITMGNTAMWDFLLTATEMQAAQVTVTVADSATKVVEDQMFIVETYGNASAQHAVDLSDSVRAGLTALPNAAAAAANGLHILGTNATAVSYTAGMTISNATGSGLTLSSGGSNGNGLATSGNGTGAGILSTGGATGHGVSAVGGATSGDGISAAGATSGHGLTVTGVGTTKHGLNATGGATTSHGISATGGGVGHGINAASGAGATGDGIRATAASTNGNGVNWIGVGTGAGELATGGATGNGINAVGGATSGAGLRAVGTNGNAQGIQAVGQGSAAGLAATGGATGHGIAATGGATSGDGLNAVAATSGHGLTATGVGTTKHGINAAGGATTSHGILATGGGIGHGIFGTSGGGSSGDGIRGTAVSTNGNGLNGVGSGVGAGLLATGGATGHGLFALGGVTSGDGINAAGQVSGHGLSANGVGTTKHGIAATGGTTTSHGIAATGGGVGHGLLATSGGGATGDGIRGVAASTNGNGANWLGVGTGAGSLATGGATGNGIQAVGGSSSGSAIKATGTAGNAIALELVGQGSADGLKATGGATGHGIEAIGGATSGDGLKASVTSGVPIRGDITANITGNLSGSVGSVTGAVGSVTGAVGSVTGAVGSVAAGGITSGSFAAGAVNAAAVADGAIDRATFAADTGLVSIRSGTAQAGAASTITLDASASATDNFYSNTRVLLTGGTGAGQVRRIRSYVGATKVATITPAWTTNPDNTSTFAVLSSSSVWDEVMSDHLTALSTGAALNAAGAAGDPWSTAIPGAYGVGTAGHRLGNVPDLVAGAAGGLFIAGTNAATTVNITGNLTGNVSGSVGSVTGAVGSVTGSVGSVTGAVGSVTGAVGSVGAGGIAAATFAANAVNAAALATDAVDEIAAAILLTPANKLNTNSDNSVVTRAHDSMKLHQATAQGPGSSTNTIQLNTSASAVDDFYKGTAVGIYGGTGAFQANRICTAYVGATREMTLDRDWVTAPDNTSTAVVHGQGGAALNSSLQPSADSSQNTPIAAAVWNRAMSSHTTAGTFGQYIYQALPTVLTSVLSGIANNLAFLTTISNTLGVWTATGSNTVLGAFKALFRKSGAAAPSDIGGTFDPTTDSVEAIRDRGDAAWTTGSGGGGGGTVVVSPLIAQTLAEISAAHGTLTARKGDTWTQPVIGLGTLTGRTKLYFTVKSDLSGADSTSIIQIEETLGLVYLAGAAATAGNGSLTVNDAANGTVTLVLAAAATAVLTPGRRYRYDFEMVTGSVVTTLATGDFHVLSDVTIATA